MKNRFLLNVVMACAFALALPFLSLKAVSQAGPKGPINPNPPAPSPSSSSTNSGSSFWGSYVVSAAACSALYPIGATIVLGRELTPREAISGVVGCWTFGVGGWIVWNTWDPKWDKLYPRPKTGRR